MKLFRVTSSKLREIYVFAHDQHDAAEIYISFKKLLDWTQDPFEMERVDCQPGWKQNRTLKQLLKAETRGVAMPHPRAREWLTEASRWMIWPPPEPD